VVGDGAGAHVGDVFDALTEEHRAATQLVDRFAASGDEALALEVAQQLRAHAAAETSVVVPELRRFVDDGDDLADEISPGLAELAAAADAVGGADQGDLGPLVEHLRTLLEQHTARMEHEVYPAMRDAGVDAVALAHALDDTAH
jgi:hypothetical protein